MNFTRTAWVLLAVLSATAVAQPTVSATSVAPALPESLQSNPAQLDREIELNRQSLEQTRKRLEELQRQLGDMGAREQTSLALIASHEQQISLTGTYIRQLQAQATARTREIARAAMQMQRTNANIEAKRQDMSRRLTGIYKYGRLLPIEALLSTRSLPEVYRKMIYLRWIARADQKLAAELSGLSRRLSQQKANLLAARAEVEKLEREHVAQRSSLNSAREAEAALLREAQTEKDAGEALRRQLSESAGRLEAVVADLQRRRAESGPTDSGRFSQSRGKLLWPARGKIIAAFGSQVHPRYKTKTNNLGVDIKTQPGTSVQAAAAGRISYADQFMGYGNLIIVDHESGFYTLYSNLDEMSASVGSDVAAGSRIGTAGDYLHFEIRIDGKPVNPTDWLGP